MKITEGGYFVGGQIAKFQSARDMPSHLKMKMRKPGQMTTEEAAAKDMLHELEEKERRHFQELLKERARGGKLLGITLPASMMDLHATPALLTDSASHSGSALSHARPVAAPAPISDITTSTNAVAALLSEFDDGDDDALDRAAATAGDDADDDDEEDDTAELMRELDRIKREREEDRLRKEREAAALADKEQAEGAMRGNPLLTKGLASALGASGVTAATMGIGGSAAVKRRFGDDTVFSHTCSAEPEARKRFINDVIRSDFHRNFLRKFVQ